MPYQVKLTETVSKRVVGFHPELKKRTKKALTEISQNPYAGKELQEDLEGYLSFRFKRYRVIYTIEEEEKTVTVYLIWHRRDVYELFAKLIGS
jgi:mRNA-degrading endonuclease RelE of RelBE toxin-antitoxin system